MRSDKIGEYKVKVGLNRYEIIKPGLFYSIDMFIPFIKLRDRHYDFEIRDPMTQYTLYVYRVLGYVLTGFVLAGLSGLTN